MWHDARGGYEALGRDPIGILLPLAGALLVEAAMAIAVREALWPEDLGSAARIGAAFVLVRALACAPFRAVALASGARALGRPAGRPLRRSLSLGLVDLLTAVAALAASAALSAPFLLAGVWLLSRGIPLLAAIAGALGLLVAALAALLVRALLAFAPAEVVLGGLSAAGALQASLSAGLGPTAVSGALLALGDISTGFGGALLGAGALPGSAWAIMAVLHRWASAGAPAAAPPG